MSLKLTTPVIVIGCHSNGSSEQAGFVTRVWTKPEEKGWPCQVNLMVMPDAGIPLTLTSVNVYENLVQATAHAARLPFAVLA